MLTTLYKGGKGLHTVVDPVRLDFTNEDGVAGLAYAIDVVIDNSFRVSRRKGSAKKKDGSFHSLFPNGDHFLAVSAGQFLAVDANYATTAIKTLASNNRMSYIRRGKKVYYLNGIDTGIAENQVYYPWTVGEYKGNTTRQFTGPPKGHLIEWYNGRVWIAQDNIVWQSELYGPKLFDPARKYFEFESRVKMMRAVSGAVFISTEERTLAMVGPVASKMEEVGLADYPAILGTDVRTSGLILEGEKKTPKEIAIWTSTEGICIGTPPGGMFFDNITKDKFEFPSTYEGTACIMDGIYVVNLIGV